VNIQVIWVFGKPEYFFKRGWTRIAGESPSGKSPGQSNQFYLILTVILSETTGGLNG
jgi:hypothetical protein